jgi:hypothetical protein
MNLDRYLRIALAVLMTIAVILAALVAVGLTASIGHMLGWWR